MLNAEIIAIGSELLTPYRLDTNSLWLTEQLNAIGIDVKLKTVVGDDQPRLEEMVGDAFRRSDIIITTGGLGPTEDDITRMIVARVLGRRLSINQQVLEKIQARFAARGIRMPEINARQAMVIDGATILENRNGTAPGLLIEDGSRTVVLLPGPPREMRPMFTSSVASVLEKRAGNVFLRRRKLSIFGLTESATDEIAAPVYTRYENPSTTILFDRGQIELHLAASSGSIAEAEALLDRVQGELLEVLGLYVFSTTGTAMEEVVGSLLKQNQKTLATAESCTGGLLASKITDVAGSSEYFIEGVVSYANQAKVDLLGVSAELIEAHGAVSEEVAREMAQGIRRRARTDIGIGITGIAGPGGGSEEKPVGLVYIGMATESGCETRKFRLPGDRMMIRHLSAQAALDMIRRMLIKIPDTSKE
jgi:nicotinamide-nucleotide amidase